MTVLHRTDLTTSQKIECAAAAVARQHEHGSKTALSETYEISRPTVYAVGATAESVLRTHFEARLLGGAGVRVRVDDAQLRRAVVALRVIAPNAIRSIEDLLPLLYPGVAVSYGTIQQMLVEAEGRAAQFNANASLGGVEAGALDEMFSQGEPVLAGVDLDTGYLFGLSLSATRDAGAWAQVLREGQGQGLSLSVVVKDAARGIAAGVPALASARIARGRCCALTSLDTPTPSTACLGTAPLACVKMNPRILIGAAGIGNGRYGVDERCPSTITRDRWGAGGTPVPTMVRTERTKRELHVGDAATDDPINGGRLKRPSFRARYASEPEACVMRRSTGGAARKTKAWIARAGVLQGELRNEIWWRSRIRHTDDTRHAARCVPNGSTDSREGVGIGQKDRPGGASRF